jgi:hypothetical protein
MPFIISFHSFTQADLTLVPKVKTRIRTFYKVALHVPKVLLEIFSFSSVTPAACSAEISTIELDLYLHSTEHRFLLHSLHFMA